MLEQIKNIKTTEDYYNFIEGRSILISSADDNIGVGNLIILRNIYTLNLSNYQVSLFQKGEKVIYDFHDFYLLQNNQIMIQESLLLLETYNKIFTSN